MEDSIEVVQTKEGRRVNHRGRHGRVKSVVIDREWEVRRAGEVIGIISYRLVEREQRSPGKRYVNYRWTAPAYTWTRGTDRFHRGVEAPSKKYAIERITREA